MTHADELKNSGLKATLPRIKVLEVFQKSTQRHMSAEDVYKHLLAEGSDVGLATVYRVLMQFEQAGMVQRREQEAHRDAQRLAAVVDLLAVVAAREAEDHDQPRGVLEVALVLVRAQRSEVLQPARAGPPRPSRARTSDRAGR